MKRGKHERAIAAEVAQELFKGLTPAMDAGADAETLISENRGLIAHHIRDGVRAAPAHQ